MEKLTFRKRIALTKVECFTNIQEKELDKAGNAKSGYYSLKTIFQSLNPIMCKYDLDIEIDIKGKYINVIWYDCLSDSSTVVELEVKPLEEIERLASMQNIVQSQGAVISYYRRYALTNALNLNATDILENAPPQQQQQQKQTQPQQQKQKQQKQVSEAQLRRLYAIMKNKDKTDEDINSWIMKKYKINSKKELTMEQYEELCQALEKI